MDEGEAYTVKAMHASSKTMAHLKLDGQSLGFSLSPFGSKSKTTARSLNPPSSSGNPRRSGVPSETVVVARSQSIVTQRFVRTEL